MRRLFALTALLVLSLSRFGAPAPAHARTWAVDSVTSQLSAAVLPGNITLSNVPGPAESRSYAGFRQLANYPTPLLGSADIVDALDLPEQPDPPPPLLLPSGIVVDPASDPAVTVDQWVDQIGPQSAAPGVGLLWHHLSYAYVLESTGLIEIRQRTL